MAGQKQGNNDPQIGYWEAVAIGVGGMVGGGIFAVLGLAVQLAQGGTPLAFTVAGVVALLTAYAYTKLSVTFPSQGGTVSFLDRAFGPGLFTGGLNILLWTSYVVMLSLYAFAFGSYGATFLPEAWQAVSSAGFLLIFAAVNIANIRLAAETHSRRWISGVGAVACVTALGALLWHTFLTSPQQVWVLTVMVGVSFAIEFGYRAATGRELRLRPNK